MQEFGYIFLQEKSIYQNKVVPLQQKLIDKP